MALIWFSSIPSEVTPQAWYLFNLCISHYLDGHRWYMVEGDRALLGACVSRK